MRNRKMCEEAGLPLPDEEPVKQQKTIVASVVPKQSAQHSVSEPRQKGILSTINNLFKCTVGLTNSELQYLHVHP